MGGDNCISSEGDEIQPECLPPFYPWKGTVHTDSCPCCAQSHAGLQIRVSDTGGSGSAGPVCRAFGHFTCWPCRQHESESPALASRCPERTLVWGGAELDLCVRSGW